MNSVVLTRDQIGHMSADRSIAKLNGKKGTVTLTGAQFPVSIEADESGTAVVVFDIPGIYFGMERFEIASHMFNNFTASNLERLACRV